MRGTAATSLAMLDLRTLLWFKVKSYIAAETSGNLQRRGENEFKSDGEFPMDNDAFAHLHSNELSSKSPLQLQLLACFGVNRSVIYASTLMELLMTS